MRATKFVCEVSDVIEILELRALELHALELRELRELRTSEVVVLLVVVSFVLSVFDVIVDVDDLAITFRGLIVFSCASLKIFKDSKNTEGAAKLTSLFVSVLSLSTSFTSTSFFFSHSITVSNLLSASIPLLCNRTLNACDASAPIGINKRSRFVT